LRYIVYFLVNIFSNQETFLHLKVTFSKKNRSNFSHKILPNGKKLAKNEKIILNITSCFIKSLNKEKYALKKQGKNNKYLNIYLKPL